MFYGALFPGWDPGYWKLTPQVSKKPTLNTQQAISSQFHILDNPFYLPIQRLFSLRKLIS